MGEILTLTGPIYLAIATGYVLVRIGLIRASGMSALGGFVINVALPALLFSVLSTRRLGDIASPTYAVAYAIAGLTSFGLVWVFARRVEGCDATAAAFHGMGASCPNSGFVGFPMLTLALPSIAGVAFGLNLIVENLLLVPLVLTLAERGSGQFVSMRAEVLGTLGRLAKTPLIIAVVLGVVVSGLKLNTPAVVSSVVDLFAKASTGVALFAVGGLLVGVSVKGMIRPLAVITAAKLLVQPLVAWAALAGLVALGMPQLAPELRAALILSAGVPVITVYPVLAQRFGQERLASAALLSSTALSFVTLSGLLAVLHV